MLLTINPPTAGLLLSEFAGRGSTNSLSNNPAIGGPMVSAAARRQSASAQARP